MVSYNCTDGSWRIKARKIFVILAAFNRRRELMRLEQWAANKHLAGPLRLYRAQHLDVERALVRYTLTSPLAHRLAHALHALNRLLSPTPRYLPKGSAAAYRRLKRESRHKSVQPIVNLF